MWQNWTGVGLVLRASGWFWHGSGPIILASGLKPDKKCHKNSLQVHSFVWIIRRLCMDRKHKLYMSHKSVSLLPLLFSDLTAVGFDNCQNNFLASGSAGEISVKIATKFNIVGSILVWYIHINTFVARTVIKLTVFHCRFATMSSEMREMEHGGCSIPSPARAVRALFRLESWATRAGEVDRGTSASSRMTGSVPRCAH